MCLAAIDCSISMFVVDCFALQTLFTFFLSSAGHFCTFHTGKSKLALFRFQIKSLTLNKASVLYPYGEMYDL